MESADATTASFAPNAPQHLQFADNFSGQAKRMVDGFIVSHQLTPPAPEPDSDDEPDPDADCASLLTSLNLTERGITSVIWSTGFGADFRYVRLPVFDNAGNPRHQNGIAPVEGLYFLGLHWLRNRASTLLSGLSDDARFIADVVRAHHRQRLEAA